MGGFGPRIYTVVCELGYSGLIGYAYQWTTNRNMNNSLLPHRDNPNMPIGFFEKQWQFFNIPGGAARFQYGRTLHEDLGMYHGDPGPNWKKWEDEEKKEE